MGHEAKHTISYQYTKESIWRYEASIDRICLRKCYLQGLFLQILCDVHIPHLELINFYSIGFPKRQKQASQQTNLNGKINYLLTASFPPARTFFMLEVQQQSMHRSLKTCGICTQLKFWLLYSELIPN